VTLSKIVSQERSSLQASMNTINANTFRLRRYSKMFSTSLHVLSQSLTEQLSSAENFPVFSSATFNSETFWLQVKPQKSFGPRHDICRRFKFGELCSYCFFWIICRQFKCRHCWMTCAESAAHASRWIGHSVRQQSVVVFNKCWKQKLMNSLNYGL